MIFELAVAGFCTRSGLATITIAPGVARQLSVSFSSVTAPWSSAQASRK